MYDVPINYLTHPGVVVVPWAWLTVKPVKRGVLIWKMIVNRHKSVSAVLHKHWEICVWRKQGMQMPRIVFSYMHVPNKDAKFSCLKAGILIALDTCTVSTSSWGLISHTEPRTRQPLARHSHAVNESWNVQFWGVYLCEFSCGNKFASVGSCIECGGGRLVERSYRTWWPTPFPCQK